MGRTSKHAAKPRVVAAVAAGKALKQAARSAGVAPSTITRWRKRDRRFDRQIVAAMQSATPHADFAASMANVVGSGTAGTPSEVFAAAALSGAVSRSDEELDAMSNAQDVLGNPDLTYVDLSRLAGRESTEIKEAVSTHPNTSGATLHYLGLSDRSPAPVVAAVIDNPRTLDETYHALLECHVWDIALARSQHTPRNVIEKLALSRHLETRDTAKATLAGLGA